MKKRTKIIIGLAALCAGTLIFGACSSNRGPYEDYAKEGFTFSVCYDANGGKTAGRDNTKVVDTYPSEQVKKGIKLYAPDDPQRGEGFNVERSGYFFAGWYAVRSPRVNGEGQPLDEEGNVCSEARDLLDAGGNPVYDDDGNVEKTYYSKEGKPQGYTYSEKWDFNSLLTRDDFEYKEGEYAFTLYAAWVPNFGYELEGQEQEWTCAVCGEAYYGEKPEKCTAAVGAADETGKVPTCGSIEFNDAGLVWHSVTSYLYDPTRVDDSTLSLPTWNEQTGVLEYGKLSQPLDKTFLSAYATAEEYESGKNAVTAFENHGSWDEETATATGNIARFYAKWDKGLWYRVSTKEQFAANAGAGRSIDLFADLAYEETDEWPAALSGGEFSGTFRGNGHKISGVAVHQTSTTDTYYGLFGRITATAVFENITFENITFSFEAASNKPGSMFGLFAGEMSSSAVMTNVAVSGTFVIGDNIYVPRGNYDPTTDTWSDPPHVYDVGLLTGNFATCGISLENITLEKGIVTASVADPSTGEIKIG